MAADPPDVSVLGPAVDLAAEHFATDRFRAKLFRALAIVGAALKDANRPYVALSGGKDSLAVAALVSHVRDDVTAMWSDDELEYPETVAYLSRWHSLAPDHLVVGLGWTEHAGWFRPWRDRPFWRDPLPGAHRVGMPADDWMARRGHDLTLLGTRAGESRRRREWLLRTRVEHGPLATYPVKGGTGRRCCPIWDWTEDDVWALIAGWRLPYNPAYDVLARIGVPRHKQRVGPLPLAPRQTLADGWPDLLERLEARYGRHWH